MNTALLRDLFNDGTEIVSAGRVARTRCQEIGTLHLSSGRIVACDPFMEMHKNAFAFSVEPERYPVFLSIVVDSQIQRVAAAMILFQEDLSPVQWTIALGAGIDGSSILVDSGNMCFMDWNLARFLVRRSAAGKLERSRRKVRENLEENYIPSLSWASNDLKDENEDNLMAFTTGAGDGAYSGWLGKGSDGQLVCLVVDFNLLDSNVS